ncbi:methylenetetrahydrofolate reductase-domain-containing protein [Crepidotus variabilis]|uniref:Methylenetetrahydrofolate reductase-domain-containing protein n=1 Tax=Crepidotus variabilis TaxID=179855 RepID=A0A9P6ED91_9AGAR|nr:methylenetetrahydrofolate reductase-domain-containing protein [Crepidotus variabilis]
MTSSQNKSLAERIASHSVNRPFYSFEFFPPRTDQGFENLVSRIERLSTLNPLAISVTWGAGGSTKDRSLELASLVRKTGFDTIIHLTCTNMQMGLVDQVLKSVKVNGIKNVLALRGDPPRGEEEWIASDSRFTRAIDLVSYIRSVPEYASWFCIGVAGYPDGHPDSYVDEDTEIMRLKEKVDAGANFIVTQLFYDADKFLSWYKKLRQKGIKVPVLPGIMPIQTYSSFLRVTKLCGARIPDSVADALNRISHDDDLVKDYGVKLTVDIIRKLQSTGGLTGFHFCTLNLEKSVQRVLDTLGWTGTPTLQIPAINKLIVETPGTPTHPSPTGESTFLISPSTASNTANKTLSSISSSETEAGRGELNNAASWDDFPNGRFGDFKSPAFGDQNLWGGSNLLITDSVPGQRHEAKAQWGSPKSKDDLNSLFLSYLQSKIPTTPFSPAPLSPESSTILPFLEKLTGKGWWTVGSQPAVNGAKSSDSMFGWGPKAGYVFQKCFVEFFCEENDVVALEKRVKDESGGWVHLFACNNQGDLRTNVPPDGRNAVTWGVFPAKEIIQTTIIEQESFLSWKDEAFSIWSEWASFYPPRSTERELLEQVRDRKWLVSLVHHDYQNADALWTFLVPTDVAKQ